MGRLPRHATGWRPEERATRANSGRKRGGGYRRTANGVPGFLAVLSAVWGYLQRTYDVEGIVNRPAEMLDAGWPLWLILCGALVGTGVFWLVLQVP